MYETSYQAAKAFWELRKLFRVDGETLQQQQAFGDPSFIGFHGINGSVFDVFRDSFEYFCVMIALSCFMIYLDDFTRRFCLVMFRHPIGLFRDERKNNQINQILVSMAFHILYVCTLLDLWARGSLMGCTWLFVLRFVYSVRLVIVQNWGG